MRALAALIIGSVLVIAPARAPAQELGRLFFTPDQRAALDARRKARVPDKPAAAAVVEQPQTRVDGAVKRGGGRSTVWVNGQPIPEGAQPGGARLGARDTGSVSVPIGESQQQIDLRVGETLDRGTGEVRDVIGEGEVKVKPRAAPTSK